jgi:hypothetical protein
VGSPHHHLSTLAWNHQGLVDLAAAACTIAIFSIVFRENPVYRLFEHIFIGVAAGYAIFVAWTEVLLPTWWQPMTHDGRWYWIFALVIGALFYFVYAGRHAWLSRLLFGALMGLQAGLGMQAFVTTYVPRIVASYKPVAGRALLDQASSLHVSIWSLRLNNIFMGIVLVTVMSYFFFSFEHKNRGFRGSALLGRWFLMFAFGAMFGATVMARMSLFIDRLHFLLNNAWIHIAR